MAKILICDPIHEDGVKMLQDAGFQVDLETDISPEKLLETIPEYDAMVIRSRTKVTKAVLDAATNLKAVARAGVGLDNVDLPYAKEKGVEVINSPEAPSNAVAELVIGLMFNIARKISEADSTMKQGVWAKKKLTGFEIKGKTLGIIGFGRIGYNLGQKAKCLGMKVIAYDVFIDRAKPFMDEVGVEGATLDQIYAESDFISIHVPLLPSTKHMISTDQFNAMKKGAYVINAARGGVIDEAALNAALNEGKIGGAALDCFESEPKPNEELVCRLNVVCTPHIGAGSVEASIGNSTIVAEKLTKFLQN